MPRVLREDSDGDPIYGEPDSATEPEWDVDGEPAKMNTKALCAAVARDILGCQIKWWGYYCDWCCGCEGNEHGCDSQCAALANPNQLYARVIGACDRWGIAVLAGPFNHVLRDALIAWRQPRKEN